MSIMWVNLIKLSLNPPRIQLIFLTKIISPCTQNWLFDNYTIIIQQVAVVRVGIDLTRDLSSIPALDCTRTLSLLTDIKHISIFHFQSIHKSIQKYTSSKSIYWFWGQLENRSQIVLIYYSICLFYYLQ